MDVETVQLIQHVSVDPVGRIWNDFLFIILIWFLKWNDSNRVEMICWNWSKLRWRRRARFWETVGVSVNRWRWRKLHSSFFTWFLFWTPLADSVLFSFFLSRIVSELIDAVGVYGANKQIRTVNWFNYNHKLETVGPYELHKWCRLKYRKRILEMPSMAPNLKWISNLNWSHHCPQ